MPISLDYDNQSQLLVVNATGTLDLKQMEEALLEVVHSDSIPSSTNALWDVSEMEFNNITLELQQDLVAMRKNFDDVRGHAKIAILCEYALAEPLVKMYSILSQELSQETRVFNNRDEALNWLKDNG